MKYEKAHVIFQNENGSKTAVFQLSDDGESLTLSLEFNPPLDENQREDELYQRMAGYFLDLLKREL